MFLLRIIKILFVILLYLTFAVMEGLLLISEKFMTDTNNVNLNNRPELSIIIPVYKVELYLKPCLDSVLAQTFTDWELILVDDGSPDNSGRICDEYAAKDSRIRVIHKSNGGVAAARNAALNITRGRYITFVDSDDEYGTDTTLEENMAILKADPSIDFLQYPYIYVDGIGNHVSAVPGQLLKSKADVLNFMLDDRITGYLWTKIFRADLFDGMRFPENVIITEDMHLLIDLQAKVHSVYLSVSGLYRYYKRDTGIVMLKTREKEMECANTYRKLLSVAAQCDDVDSIALARRFLEPYPICYLFMRSMAGMTWKKD